MAVIQLADFKKEPLRIVFEGGLEPYDFDRASRSLASRLKVGAWMCSKGEGSDGDHAYYMEFDDDPGMVKRVISELFTSQSGYKVYGADNHVRDVDGIKRRAITVAYDPKPELCIM